MKPVLRKAKPADVPALVGIEEISFESDNWHPEDFGKDDCTVAEVGGQIVGFLVSREIFGGSATELPEREILNLAVAPRFRRQGIGKLLLKRELTRKAVFFLEVRKSNVPAQNLYKLLGFKKIGQRPQFYSHPTETAIVMRMK